MKIIGSDEISFEEILEQLPGHIYWKNKDGVYLGSNRNNWSDFGVISAADCIGKTDYDLINKQDADKIKEADNEVMRSGEFKVFEEIVNDIVYLSYKKPLKNKRGQIIGILGTSVDITKSKRETLNKLKMLENIIAIIPAHVYWMNREGVYLGCNDKQSEAIGLTSRQEIVGKRNVDIRGFLIPEVLDPINEDVMKSGKTISAEEPAVLKDGTRATFFSTKTPLYDYDHKEIIGMVGISIDITDRKEKERLQTKDETQKIRISEQEVFRREIGKLVHDGSTPLGTIMMVLGAVKSLIPEDNRITMVSATSTLRGIFDNLRSRYKKEQDDKTTKPTIISLLLSQAAEGKRVQITNAKIEFTYDFDDCHFSFISVNQLALRRSIANLINNAVDAMDRNGLINFCLNKKNGFIEITIKDNGKGMPQDVLDKLRNNIAVSSGKEDGHGIGFTQIRETIEQNKGTVNIDSVQNQGTTITVMFPEIEPPSWAIKELCLNKKDTLVVLDDDSSIHGAWDAKFQKYDVSIKHFTIGQEAVDFINSFPDKNKLFLLADFELLDQSLSGVDVIKKTFVRSVLVTSHFGDDFVLKLAVENNIKVLPKQLAAEVTIIINDSSSEKTDVVVIEGIQILADATALPFRNKNKRTDTYCSLGTFLQNISKYDQNTIIMMSDFKYDKLNSFDVLKDLHNRGFTRLYLLSESEQEKDDIPPKYVTLISRDDVVTVLAENNTTK